MAAQPKEVATDLEFLRYFYENVDVGLGIAAPVVKQAIRDSFEHVMHKQVPEAYDGED